MTSDAAHVPALAKGDEVPGRWRVYCIGCWQDDGILVTVCNRRPSPPQPDQWPQTMFVRES
jgi:hypothetical protein